MRLPFRFFLGKQLDNLVFSYGYATVGKQKTNYVF